MWQSDVTPSKWFAENRNKSAQRSRGILQVWVSAAECTRARAFILKIMANNSGTSSTLSASLHSPSIVTKVVFNQAKLPRCVYIYTHALYFWHFFLSFFFVPLSLLCPSGLRTWALLSLWIKTAVCKPSYKMAACGKWLESLPLWSCSPLPQSKHIKCNQMYRFHIVCVCGAYICILSPWVWPPPIKVLKTSCGADSTSQNK